MIFFASISEMMSHLWLRVQYRAFRLGLSSGNLLRVIGLTRATTRKRGNRGFFQALSFRRDHKEYYVYEARGGSSPIFRLRLGLMFKSKFFPNFLVEKPLTLL